MKTIHIIGGGITGCSLSYFLKDKYKIKLYEKTSQLGGLSQTLYNIENIPYQKGVHILHTNNTQIINIIKKAGVEIQRVFYDVAINPLIDFKYYKFPFNEESINLMPWHWREAALMDINKINGSSGKNLKELIINFYGSTIYDIFYKNYIKKLTGLEADNIDQTQWFRKNLHAIDKVINFYTEDCYFPLDEGWNKLFYSLTEGVNVEYGMDMNYNNFNKKDLIILTTRPDIFFNKEIIPYIGLEFDIDSVNYDMNKPDTIIYPNHVPFISMTQYGKLFSPKKQIENKNIISKEYMSINNGEDAYPVPTFINITSYNKIVNEYKHIYYCGPLARYKHMSMTEAIENAQQVATEIKHRER